MRLCVRGRSRASNQSGCRRQRRGTSGVVTHVNPVTRSSLATWSGRVRRLSGFLFLYPFLFIFSHDVFIKPRPPTPQLFSSLFVSSAFSSPQVQKTSGSRVEEEEVWTIPGPRHGAPCCTGGHQGPLCASWCRCDQQRCPSGGSWWEELTQGRTDDLLTVAEVGWFPLVHQNFASSLKVNRHALCFPPGDFFFFFQTGRLSLF